MSSSADPPGWEHFQPRPAAAAVDLRSPASELAAVLQQHHEKWTTLTAESKEELRSVVVPLAVLVHRLDDALDRLSGADHRELRMLGDAMTHALKNAGVTVLDPVGQPDAEVGHLVNVDGWRHGANFPDDVVAETIKPVILLRGELLELGRVIMGAPTRDQPAEETA